MNYKVGSLALEHCIDYQTVALNRFYCKTELMLELYFSVITFSGLTLHFHGITDYSHGLFLCA